MSASNKTVHVVSPQLPCGAAWLANALLELRVPIGNLWGFDTAAEWQREDDGSLRYAAANLPWRQTLASLRLGRRFQFRAGFEARFSHEFPWQGTDADCTIVMVRDPRDALYSEFRRHQRNLGLPGDIDLPEFSASPFMQGPISQRDLLWLHMRCWLRPRAGRAIHFLRFEDCKQQPLQTLQRVAGWLDLPVIGSELADAVAASEVRHLQAIESQLARHDPSARQFNRLGQAYEWRQRWSQDWHESLGAHWQDVLLRLQYPELQRASRTGTDFDTATVLRWRDLSAGERYDDWMQAIERWKIGAAAPCAEPA